MIKILKICILSRKFDYFFRQNSKKIYKTTNIIRVTNVKNLKMGLTLQIEQTRGILVATLTKADMVEHLMNKLSLSKQESRKLVDDFFAEITKNLAHGREVKLSGFGNFYLNDKSARPGRNPKTGELVEISARRVVSFKAGQKFRNRLK